MTEEQRRILEQQLWAIANDLRGKMGADEFRDYILGFIFYKYLSERMEAYADEALRHDSIRFNEIEEMSDEGKEILDAVRDASVETLGYFLKPSELFGTLAGLAADKVFIMDRLESVLNNIERSTLGTASEDDFDHLFEDLDLGSTKLGRTEAARNELISKVLVHLNKIDFGLDDAKSDLLGDAYEYLIGMFASGAGKKAGEFYTPQSVSTVLARIVTAGKNRLKSVYDPTCGSGSLLLRVAREVAQVGDFYGQEMNRTTYNLARMNMILHGVHYRSFNLRQENTLEHPQHEGMKFEAIVANPPFSAKWSASDLFKHDDRFAQYGRLAPASKADFAFIQHMLHHLDDNGTMAVVLPHGVLFRGAAEGVIRRYIIEEKNWLDAVIGLPPNIFYGTSIPTCILVMKKCREASDDVLFVDASSRSQKGKNQNWLSGDDVQTIVSAYLKRENVQRFSAVVTREEIAENEFNLNIPRYVETFETAEQIDLAALTRNLKAIEAEMSGIDNKLRAFCNELGLEAPV